MQLQPAAMELASAEQVSVKPKPVHARIRASVHAHVDHTRRKDHARTYDRARSGYFDQYEHLFVWLALLMGGWTFNKVFSDVTRVPPDAVIEWSSVLTIFDIQIVCGYGMIQAWFTDVLNGTRYRHVFAQGRQRWWFFVLFLGSGPVFGCFSLLSFSALTEDGVSGQSLATYAATAVVVVALLAWHLRYAWAISTHIATEDRRARVRSAEDDAKGPSSTADDWTLSVPDEELDTSEIARSERKYFWTYLVSRAVIVTFFALYAVKIVHSPESTLHAHHWFLSWALSLFCQFDHPLSLACLAVTAGVFVQGCAAYHAGELGGAGGDPFYLYTWPEEKTRVLPAVRDTGAWLQCVACGEGGWGTCGSTCPIPTNGQEALIGACRPDPDA